MLVEGRIPLDGVFYFGWVIHYGALVLIFAAAHFPFLLHLPPQSRNLVALAGVVFVAGALGLEMLGGHFLVTHGPGVLTGITVIAEEMLELTGVVIFIHALLVYLRGYEPAVTLAIAPVTSGVPTSRKSRRGLAGPRTSMRRTLQSSRRLTATLIASSTNCRVQARSLAAITTTRRYATTEVRAAVPASVR